MHSRSGKFFVGLGALVIGFSQLDAQTSVLNDQTYINNGLIGVGRISADTRDQFGETFGSFSGFTVDRQTWARSSGGIYSGTLFAQPDRGYSSSGTTTNYTPRFNKLTFTFTPAPAGALTQDQAVFTLVDTIKFTESNGTPLTGADATLAGGAVRAGFPSLPQAFNGRLALDAEGIVINPDGSLWVSDEYGPYVFKFSPTGVLLAALRPPEALIPKRASADSFSSASPYPGQPSPSPSNPVTGRQNSQGLEGLTVTPDGRTLFTLLQSATRQDGGNGGSSLRQHTRLVAYDLTTATPTLKGEYVIVLPSYLDGANTRIAASSEILAINSTQLLVLARDSNGHGSSNPTSLFRKVLVYDISGATNIAGSVYDTTTTPISPGSVLAAGIVPAVSTALVDINDPVQLAKFGLTNGPVDSANNLSDKWEALALVPALDPSAPNDWLLLIGNDNDFLTLDGFQDGAAYNAGLVTDSLVLVYRLTIPSRLTYVSTLARTGNGNGNGNGNAPQIGTFTVNGARPKTMLIRGVGPSLSTLGITGISDPQMTLFNSADVVLATNDDWGSNPIQKPLIIAAAAQSGAFPLTNNSKDSAIIAILDPGTYTVELKSSSGQGQALLEIIEVP